MAEAEPLDYGTNTERWSEWAAMHRRALERAGKSEQPAEPATRSTASRSEAAALAIARQAVATNDGKFPAWLQTNVIYRARAEGAEWSVVAEIIVGTNAAGEPMIEIGGQRFIRIDERGAVTHYGRGR